MLNDIGSMQGPRFKGTSRPGPRRTISAILSRSNPVAPHSARNLAGQRAAPYVGHSNHTPIGRPSHRLVTAANRFAISPEGVP